MTAEKPVGKVLMLASERRSVGVIALISMIRMFGLFALLPVLSLYAADLEGATPLLIGLAVGAYGLTQAGFQIPLGVLSDRVGRIPVILVGLAIFAAGSALAAVSDTIYGVIAGRLLQGAGAISATLTALITDATRAQVRTRSMAVFGIGMGVSFALAMVGGPLIAGNLESVHLEEVEEEYLPSMVWASWAEWADAYERCRAQYLATPAGHPHRDVPDSEPIYAAIRAGEDPDEVIAALWRERHANDPRDLLYAAAREGR